MPKFDLSFDTKQIPLSRVIDDLAEALHYNRNGFAGRPQPSLTKEEFVKKHFRAYVNNLLRQSELSRRQADAISKATPLEVE